jgi:hypothetical protein
MLLDYFGELTFRRRYTTSRPVRRNAVRASYSMPDVTDAAGSALVTSMGVPASRRYQLSRSGRGLDRCRDPAGHRLADRLRRRHRGKTCVVGAAAPDEAFAMSASDAKISQGR